jgi:hypothetical protein
MKGIIKDKQQLNQLEQEAIKEALDNRSVAEGTKNIASKELLLKEQDLKELLLEHEVLGIVLIKRSVMKVLEQDQMEALDGKFASIGGESGWLKMVWDIIDETVIEFHNVSYESLFSALDLTRLLKVMQLNGKIKSLDLSNNPKLLCGGNYREASTTIIVKDSIVSNVVETLKANPHLEYLNLSHTNISDTSMSSIVSVLETLLDLKSLDLSCNIEIEILGFKDLVNYIIKNRSLNELNIADLVDVFGMNIDHSLFLSGVVDIMSARPEVTIKVSECINDVKHPFQQIKDLSKELSDLSKARFAEWLKVKLSPIFSNTLSSLEPLGELDSLLVDKVTEIITDYLPTPGDNCGVTIMGLDALSDSEAVEIHV